MPETSPHHHVGRPLKRIEDPRLITGRGQYVEDLKLPGLAYLAFLRSPHAHARVTALGLDAAGKAAGVLRVVTARDLPPLRPLPYMAVLPGLKQSLCSYLADTVVDATGVPVAAVVAESPSLARDAIELIEVAYEPLPAVFDPGRALRSLTRSSAPIRPSAGRSRAATWTGRFPRPATA
jgi:carbon-monoxide dehydrogenase large subunit